MPNSSARVNQIDAMHANAKNVKVDIINDIDLAELEAQWQQLQEASSHRFFLSWHWIKAWLETCATKPFLLRAKEAEQTIGLALCCERQIRRNGFVINRCIVHETGVANNDQQWIEFNDLLLHKAFEETARAAMLTYLKAQKNWDELAIGVADSGTITNFAKALQLPIYTTWKTRAHHINLASLRESNSDYLSSLSKNARAQIRRSLKAYQQLGEVTIKHATCEEQALEFLDEIAPIHIQRWGSGYQESGFANPTFVDFHKQLIRNSFKQGVVDIIRIDVGEAPIAYLYNFIYQSRVYFYLSALKFESDNKLKPGLLSHALCIQEYMDKGLDLYDFMGGGESYKDRLANHHDEFYRVAFQQPRLTLKLERFLRKTRNYIQNRKPAEFRLPR
uniref:GNAT family N-acetyltransferase n=1 Tax=Ningiella ruwaisensis TaxID=2364274 RepID=UPI00109F85B0|nr:GNAT family N-acetyltransferase [Ningiella ruwaisensis]